MLPNDGTTGIQVAPIPENEMSHIRSIFDRAANAIVQASELATQVNELTNTVATIKADFEKTVSDLKIEVEHVRSQNRWLDEQLASVRKQRDDANNELSTVKGSLGDAQHDNDMLRKLTEDQVKTIEHVRSELASARKERDDYASMSQAFSDDLDEAKAKLAKIKESLGIVDPPKSAEVATSAPTFQPSPSVVPANMPEATQSVPTPVTTLYPAPQEQTHPEPDQPATGTGPMPWRNW